jgi:hypothetical protein
VNPTEGRGDSSNSAEIPEINVDPLVHTREDSNDGSRGDHSVQKMMMN